MPLSSVTLKDVAAFSSGALLVLLVLLLLGRIGDHGPACNTGLEAVPSVTYIAYQSTTYGLPVPALRVEQIDCQEPPAEWGRPKTVLTWYPLGLVVALLQLLLGELLGRWLLRS
jgi:hypothetical protein